jgi:DNA-directed RNA polymerase subunit RPC12/RpoP
MVKFFCNACGKEIWQNMDDGIKRTETVAELEKTCLCSDCSVKINQGGHSGIERTEG